MRKTHSIYFIGVETDDYRLFYQEINKYLLKGFRVIYAVESNLSLFMKKASAIIQKLKSHIKTKTLVIINPSKLFRTLEERGVSPADLAQEWKTLGRAAMKSKAKGLVVFDSPDFAVRPDRQSIDSMISYETKIGKKFSMPLEIICCYHEEVFSRFSIADAISVLNAHRCVIHSGWFYEYWQKETIISLIRRCIDDILRKGASDLFFKTLKLVYKIRNVEEFILTRPEVFEMKLKKILGDKTAKLISNAIMVDIKAVMQGQV